MMTLKTMLKKQYYHTQLEERDITPGFTARQIAAGNRIYIAKSWQNGAEIITKIILENTMQKVDIIIPLGNGSKSNNDELKILLRSERRRHDRFHRRFP